MFSSSVPETEESDSEADSQFEKTKNIPGLLISKLAWNVSFLHAKVISNGFPYIVVAALDLELLCA